MIIQRITRNVIPSLVFVITPAMMFAHRFLEALIAGFAVTVIVSCTILISSFLRFTNRMITRLANVFIAMTLVSFLQVILELVIPDHAHRFKIFLPLLILNIILLSPHMYLYRRNNTPFATLAKLVLIFSFVYGVGIAMLGLIQELIIFREISLSFINRKSTFIIDNSFRLLLFAPGSLLFLGYIHAAMQMIEERNNP